MSYFSKYMHFKARIFLGFLLLGTSVLTPLPSNAQSSRDVMNRLNRIENEVQTLNRAVYKGQPIPPSSQVSSNPQAQAATEIRLQQLETELRQLRGKIEEDMFQRQQLQTAFEKLQSDLEFRISELEKGGHLSASRQAPSSPPQAPYLSQSQTPPPYTWSSNPAQTEPAAGMKASQNLEIRGPRPDMSGGALSTSMSDKAAAAYENAFSMLKNAQYESAGQNFEYFLRQYPNHVLAGNAKYWLGETYYVRGDYETAARIFAEGYQQYPKGSKAPDNLLKLGMALSGIGNKEDACVALGQLEKDFPDSATPVLRRANQEMTRLGCS